MREVESSLPLTFQEFLGVNSKVNRASEVPHTQGPTVPQSGFTLPVDPSTELSLNEQDSVLQAEAGALESALQDLTRRYLLTQTSLRKTEEEEVIRIKRRTEGMVERERARLAVSLEQNRLQSEAAQRDAADAERLRLEEDETLRCRAEALRLREEERKLEAEIQQIYVAAEKVAQRRAALSRARAEREIAIQQEVGKQLTHEHEQRISSLTLELERIQEELRVAAEKETTLSRRLNELVVTRQDQQARLEEATVRLHNERQEQSRQELETLRRAADEQREQLSAAEDARSKAIAELDEVREKVCLAIANKDQQLAELEQLRLCSQEKTAQQEKQIQKLTQETDNYQETLERQKLALGDLAVLVETLQQQIKQHQVATVEQENTLEELKKSSALLETKVGEYQRAISDEETRSNELQAVALRYKSDLDTCVNLNAEHQQHLEELNASLTDQQTVRDSHVASIKKLEDDLQRLQLEQSSLQESLDEATRLHEAELARIEQLRTASETQHVGRLKELEAQRNAAEREAQSRQLEAEQLVANLESVRASAEEQARVGTQRVNELQLSIENLRVETEEHSAEVARLEEVLRVNVAALRQAEAKAQTEADELRAQIGELRMTVRNHEGEVAGLKRDLQNEELHLTQVQAILATEYEREQANQQAADEAQRLAELREAQENANHKLSELKKQTEEAEFKLNELQNAQAEAQERLNATTESYAHVSSELELLEISAADEAERLQKATNSLAAQRERSLQEHQQLKEELEQQLLACEAAERERLAEIESLKIEAEEQARRVAQEEEAQLASLTASLRRAEEEAKLRSQQEAEVLSLIEKERQSAEEQQKRVNDLHELLSLEQKTRSDAQALKALSVDEQRCRIDAIVTHNESEEKRLGELQKMRAEAEEKLHQCSDQVRQANEVLQELYRNHDEQRKLLEERMAHQREEQKRLKLELDALKERAKTESRLAAEEVEQLRSELEQVNKISESDSQLATSVREDLKRESDKSMNLSRALLDEQAKLAELARLNEEQERELDKLRRIRSEAETRLGQLRAEADERSIKVNSPPLEAGSQETAKVPSRDQLPEAGAAESVEVVSGNEDTGDADFTLVLEQPAQNQAFVPVEAFVVNPEEDQPEPTSETPAEAEFELKADFAAKANASEAIQNSATCETNLTKTADPTGSATPDDEKHALEPSEPIRLDSASTPVLTNGETSVDMFENPTANITPTLRKQLEHPDATQRAAALSDISRIGGDEAFELIANSFDDPSAQVRNAAARAIYGLDADHAGSFTRVLRESSPQRRLKIGRAIAESGLANDALLGLSSGRREQTYDAFSILFLMVKAGELQPLAKAIEENPNIDTRLSAITMLATSGHPDVVGFLRRVAVRVTIPAEVRSAAMEAIHNIAASARAEAPPAIQT